MVWTVVECQPRIVKDVKRTGRVVWHLSCTCGWNKGRQFDDVEVAVEVYAREHQLPGQLSMVEEPPL